MWSETPLSGPEGATVLRTGVVCSIRSRARMGQMPRPMDLAGAVLATMTVAQISVGANTIFSLPGDNQQ